MTRQLALGVRLPDLASFDNYHPGPNAEAVAAIQELAAARPGLLFVYGASGTGKSHLLYAAVKKAESLGRCAIYASRSAATGDGSWLDLPARGLVCLDDMNEGLTVPEARALLSLYEGARSTSGSLLLSSRYPPSAVDWVLPDLSSRVQSDLVYRLAALEEAELAAALRLRAAHRGLLLSDDVLRYVLRRYERSPLALFRLLDRVDAESLARKRRVTVPFLRALESEVENSGRR